MPTIIDSLLVELGLDSAKFVKGHQDAVLAFDKTKKYAEKSAKDIEDSGKKSSSFFSQLKKEALELFAVYETAKSFTKFVTDVREGNKELGFAAKQLNLTTEQLSSLRGMANLTGTSTESLTGSLQKFSQLYQQFATNPGPMHGSPLWGYLSGLHMSIVDLKDANTILLKLAEAVDKIQDPARKVKFLSEIGLDADTIKIVIQGAETVKKLRAEAEKQVHVSQEAVKAAGDLTQAWGGLSNVFYQWGTDLSQIVNPPLIGLNNLLKDHIAWINQITESEDIPRLAKDYQELGAAWDRMIKSNFGKFMGEFIARLKQSGPQLLSTFKQVFGAVFDWLKTAFNYIWEKVFGFKPFSDVFGMGASAATGGAAGVGGSTGAGVVTGAAPTVREGAEGASATTDTRNFWQRHAPKVLGGKEAPSITETPKVLGGKEAPTETPREHNAPAGSLTALINREATAAGIDPHIMEGIRAGESAHTSKYDVKDDRLESSWGPFQLNRRRGLGVEFERDTGLDVRNPNTITAQTRWVAQYIKKHGGTNNQWMGYRGPRNADPRWGESGYRGEHQHQTTTPHKDWGQMTDNEVDATVDAIRVHAARHRLLQQLGKQHVTSLRHGSQYAFLGSTHASHDHSQHTSSVNVGNVNVHTSSTDARGIARDMREAMDRELLANQSNYGLA